MAKENLLTHLSAYADETSVIERDRLYQRLRDVYFKNVKRVIYKCTIKHTVITDGHAKNITGVVMGEFITNISLIEVAQLVEADIVLKWKVLQFKNDLTFEIKQI